MADIVDQVSEALRKLPPERQQDLARYVLMLADQRPVALSPEEEEILGQADDEIARGEFTSPEEVEAFWKSRGV